MKASSKHDSQELLNSDSSDTTNTALATAVFDATVPTAALFSKAIVHAVDYFLDDANEQARGEIVGLFWSRVQDSSAEIMGYVREALRLNPIVSNVWFFVF